MIDVLKVFYPTHYNFAALSILLLLLLIYLLTKKNIKWGLIVLAILLVFNVVLYKRTEGKSWTIIVEPEKTDDPYMQPQPQELTFSAAKNWEIVDEKGVKHHWCWVEVYWDKFASTDLIAKIWGSNSSKKMMKSTESRMNEASGE
ncbi:MAG: hypothetical protein MJY82_00080 [Fibrobacter sp.]|nr:hypothetical protein [Fibrobacter sp.]